LAVRAVLRSGRQGAAEEFGVTAEHLCVQRQVITGGQVFWVASYLPKMHDMQRLRSLATG